MKAVRRLILIVAVLAMGCAPLLQAANPPEWTQPMPPFRIAGNLYYVGSEDLAAFLVVTPKGNILINSNLASSPPQIRHSIEQLGFRWRDTRILLISHAHFDHAAGSAEVLKETGATYAVMDADVPVIESGGRDDFALGKDPQYRFARAHVDRVLHDGDTVELDGTVLTAHKTAGHTRGTTTWTMELNEAGKTLHVVIVGSPNVLDSYKLVGNRAYPQIADDFRHQFEVLKALPCDVFLGAHGVYFGLKEKFARFKAGDRKAFVDPDGYRAFVEEKERAFETALKHQQGHPSH
jgi:metallo-beta-lactamase class B